MSNLFIDSSFLVSLFRQDDDNHELIKQNRNILEDNKCFISNGIVTEVITVLMMRTKNKQLTNLAYYFMQDNFTIVNEYEISEYNDKVFSVFKNYNVNSYKVSFIDCSSVIISNHFGFDYVVALDNGFKLFDDIKLYPINL